MKNKVSYYRKKSLLTIRDIQRLSGLALQTVFDLEHNIERKKGYQPQTIFKIYACFKKRIKGLKLQDIFPDLLI